MNIKQFIILVLLIVNFVVSTMTKSKVALRKKLPINAVAVDGCGSSCAKPCGSSCGSGCAKPCGSSCGL